MKKVLSVLTFPALVMIFAAGCASQTASTPAAAVPTNITVTYKDSDKFTDARSSFSSDTNQGYLDILSNHLKKAASAHIKPDQKLEITVTDVDLAGDFLPGRASGNDVRIIKEIYRPRVTLTYKLTGADGKVVKEGDRTLTDSFFMNNLGNVGRNDPLFYDKALLDTWVRDEFKS